MCIMYALSVPRGFLVKFLELYWVIVVRNIGCISLDSTISFLLGASVTILFLD